MSYASEHRAISYLPAEATARLLPVAPPGPPAPGEVLVHTALVGFCGTDREIVRGGGIAVVPPGSSSLVLGHEMSGIVAEVGEGVEGLRRGQSVVSAVRRGCRSCAPCATGRSDFCLTGGYLEHGITLLDGFARPSLVVPATSLVPVDGTLGPLAVLAEPLSIVEKAVEQARHVLSRIPGLSLDGPRWGTGRRALVAGAGPIGLLATYLLVELGFTVEVIDLLDPDRLAPGLALAAGASYAKVDRSRPDEAASGREPAEVIVEASGDPRLAFELLGALAPGGVLVWVGVGGDGQTAQLDVGRAVLRSVLNHHAVVGTINSARVHFEQAVEHLEVLSARPRFDELITGVFPPEQFELALWPKHESIKQVVEYVPVEKKGGYRAAVSKGLSEAKH